jgi:hypothetical protein
MNTRLFPCAVGVLVVACCHRAPEEPAAATDAATDAGHSAGGEARADAAASSTAPGDGGRGQAHDFCLDAYLADYDRLRATCTSVDANRIQSLASVAAGLCTRDLTAVLAASRASFDSEAASRCVEMLREKALPRSSESDTFFEHFPCDRVLLGTQETGKRCRFSVECKDGLACVVTPPGPEGTCMIPPAAGSACSRQAISSTLNDPAAALHHPACAKGSWCDGRTCQSRLGTGKSCVSRESCTDGLACVMGKCAAPSPLGGLCQKSSDCVFGLRCAAGSADAGGGQCRAKLTAGADCANADSCKGRCDLATGPDGKQLDHGKCVPVCGSG